MTESELKKHLDAAEKSPKQIAAVAADWHIEVPFHFKFCGDPCCQPRMYALFTLSDVPEKERHEFEQAFR